MMVSFGSDLSMMRAGVVSVLVGSSVWKVILMCTVVSGLVFLVSSVFFFVLFCFL